MTIINFYCIEDDVNQFLHSFLTNVVVENNKKVIIYSENQEKINKLDESLWTMKKTSFLPHLKINEEGFEETPLLIDTSVINLEIENDNKYLINVDDMKKWLENL